MIIRFVSTLLLLTAIGVSGAATAGEDAGAQAHDPPSACSACTQRKQHQVRQRLQKQQQREQTD